MRPQDALDCLVRPGLRLMGEPFDTPAAAFVLLVIGLYESGFRRRYQLDGPARGFWQFEPVAVVEAVRHEPVRRTLRGLVLPDEPARLWAVLPALDLGAVVLARGLLWSHPEPLPSMDASTQDLHRYYCEAWRPGKAPYGRFVGSVASAIIALHDSGDPDLADV